MRDKVRDIPDIGCRSLKTRVKYVLLRVVVNNGNHVILSGAKITFNFSRTYNKQKVRYDFLYTCKDPSAPQTIIQTLTMDR